VHQTSEPLHRWEANRAGLSDVASVGRHEDPAKVPGRRLNGTPTSSVYFSLSFWSRSALKADAFGADLRLGLERIWCGKDIKIPSQRRNLRPSRKDQFEKRPDRIGYFEKIPEFRPYSEAALCAARLIMRLSRLLVTIGFGSSPSGFGEFAASGFVLSV